MMASLMHLRIRNREMAYEESKYACNYRPKLHSTSISALNGKILQKLHAVFTRVTLHFES
jgi:hypothetical protein